MKSQNKECYGDYYDEICKRYFCHKFYTIVFVDDTNIDRYYYHSYYNDYDYTNSTFAIYSDVCFGMDKVLQEKYPYQTEIEVEN